MPDLSCVTCGGADFYKNAGYFFCSECQTQAQDIQEQEFELGPGDETVLVNKSRKIKSASSSKASRAEQLTSWECYNYILLGLVNEMIELGAKENLKPIVQTIWLSYLKKIEVLHNDTNKPPMLPAYNNKHDAKVIFGRCAKKKVYKRKRQTSCSSYASASDAGSTVSIREQNRLKRAMAKAVYESQQTQSTILSESSVLNQSLGSLKSNNSETHKENFLNYSKQAKTELRKHMSKTHMKEHVEDVDVSLTCHNLSFKDVGKGYGDGPHVMKPIILYVILYLALLINKDDIQIGDMLRFMNEGSLSYNYYMHFFPEEIDTQISFLNTLQMNKLYKHDHIRLSSGKMVELLKLKDDIPVPNIVNLVKRYCKELNLPNEIYEICIHFITYTHPQMNITTTLLPNYEGKAMCVIVFILKLFFGLDDSTEIHLSMFAIKINSLLQENDHNNGDEREMFNFMDWLQTIAYRRCMLAKHHFPTGYIEKNVSTQEYIDFINSYYIKYDLQRQVDLDYENIDRVVFSNTDFERKMLQFNASLTPLYDNLKTLYESGKLQAENTHLEVLLRNFQDSSIEYLKEPSKFITEDTVILNRGANDNLKMVPIHRTQKPHENGNRFVSCKLSNKCADIPEILPFRNDTERITKEFLHQFDHLHADKFNQPMNRSFNKNGICAAEYSHHYRPDRRHWLHLGPNIKDMTVDEFDKFWLKFPYYYRLLISECAYITSQSVKEILLEYNYFEAFVCYGNSFGRDEGKKRRGSKRINQFDIRTIVTMGKQRW